MTELKFAKNNYMATPEITEPNSEALEAKIAALRGKKTEIKIERVGSKNIAGVAKVVELVHQGTLETLCRVKDTVEGFRPATVKSGTNRPQAQVGEKIKALLIIQSLSQETGEKKSDWERLASIESINEIRREISLRAIEEGRRVFTSASEEELTEISNALLPFREASRSIEIEICKKFEIAPNNGSRFSSHTAQRTAGMPNGLEETIGCLTHLYLSALNKIGKNNPINKENVETLVKELENLRRTSDFLPENLKKVEAAAKENLGNKVPEIEVIFKAWLEKKGEDVAKEVFEQIRKVGKTIELTEEEQKKISLIESATLGSIEDNGDVVENLSKAEKIEFKKLRELEEIYSSLEEWISGDKKENGTSKEIEEKIEIFKELKSLGLSKGATMVLLSELVRDKKWFKTWKEKEESVANHPEVVHAIKVDQYMRQANSLVESEEEITDWGLKGQNTTEEKQTLSEACFQIEEIEGELNKNPLREILQATERKEIFEAAQRIFSGEDEKTEAEKDLKQIWNKAEELSEGLAREIDEKTDAVETISKALIAREEQEEFETALSCVVEEVSFIKEGLDEIIERLGVNNAESSKNIRKTLIAIRNIENINRESLDWLCDRNAEAKQALEIIRDVMGDDEDALEAFKKVRQSVLTLRSWRGWEEVKGTPEAIEIAASLVVIPETLKKSAEREIIETILACTRAPFYQSLNGQRLVNSESNRLLLKKELEEFQKEVEPEIYDLGKSILEETSAIISKEGPKSVGSREKLAESLIKGGLREKQEEIGRWVLKSKNPIATIQFLKDWNNTIGNQQILINQSVLSKGPAIGELTERQENKLTYHTLIRLHNLKEVKKYADAVKSSPEALAETYIQNKLSKEAAAKNVKREDWTQEIEKAKAKLQEQIEIKETEVKDLEERANKALEGIVFEEENINPVIDKEILAATIERKKRARRREINMLKDRLNSVKDLHYTVSKLKPRERKERDELKEDEVFENSIGKALLIAAAGGLKFQLPDKLKVEWPITPHEMMQGAEINLKLEKLNKQVLEIKKKLERVNIRVDDRVNEENGVKKNVTQLKNQLFVFTKELELLHPNDKLTNINLGVVSPSEEATPELLDKQKEWVKGIQQSVREARKIKNYIEEKKVAKKIPKKIKTEVGMAV